MKLIFALIFGNLVSLSLVALAWWMVMHDKPYYGWVVFAAIVSAVTVSNEES